MGERFGELLDQKKFTLRGVTLAALLAALAGAAFTLGSIYTGFDNRLAAAETRLKDLNDLVLRVERIDQRIQFLYEQAGGRPAQ